MPYQNSSSVESHYTSIFHSVHCKIILQVYVERESLTVVNSTEIPEGSADKPSLLNNPTTENPPSPDPNPVGNNTMPDPCSTVNDIFPDPVRRRDRNADILEKQLFDVISIMENWSRSRA